MQAYELYDSQTESPDTNKKKYLIAAIPFIAILAASGTGGMITNLSWEQSVKQSYQPEITIESSVAKIDTRSPAEHVAFIREAFALSTSDLAAVLNVTRPTIYAWLEGQEPKPEALCHIQKIAQVAVKLQSLQIARIETLVNRPIFDGHSILDKLKANEDTAPYFTILKKLADKEETARQTQKGFGKSIHSISDATSDYSTPLYGEDE